MTIPLGTLCSTGRIVEDVRPAVFRGHATSNHISVHPQQPQGEDAFGYAFADILNNCAKRKQYDDAGKKNMLEAGFQVSDHGFDMSTGVKNASVDCPSHALTSRGPESTLKAHDKAVLSDVFDDCWPRDTQTGIPYDLMKKTPRFLIAASPYIERICYAIFNYRAGYTAANHIFTKEIVMAAFRKYTPSPLHPTPLRPSLCVVLTVHLVMYMKPGSVRNSLEALHHSELGRYYQDGKCPPSNVVFKGEEEVCEMPAQSLRWTIVSSVQRNKVVSLLLPGTVASPKLPGYLVGVMAQQQKRAGGIIKHNTNAIKNMAATQAVPGDNVDEGSSPEPPARKGEPPAKPAVGVPARGRAGAGAMAGSGAFESRGGRLGPVAAAASTREQKAGSCGGPGRNRI
eukprot:jgi/Tetstr1/427668/TSEL_017793.t1